MCVYHIQLFYPLGINATKEKAFFWAQDTEYTFFWKLVLHCVAQADLGYVNQDGLKFTKISREC